MNDVANSCAFDVMGALRRNARGLSGWRLLVVAWLLCLGVPAQAETAADVLRGRLEGHLSGNAPLTLAPRSAPRAIAQFYAMRDWQPVWDAPRYQALLAALAGLEADGLNPEDYALSQLRRLPATTEAARVADRELLATRSCLLALLHLYHGKVDPQQLDPHWNFDGPRVDPGEGLLLVQAAVEQNRLDEVFQRARPQLPFYYQLREALARLRKVAAAGGWPALPSGPTLEPGMRDARVPLLRERLQLAGLLPATAVPEPELFGEFLREAVLRFQREASLLPDGRVGPATRTELNVPVAARIDQLRVNLERLRWFHNKLSGRAVVVDLAGFRIFYLVEGEAKWSARVQIGRDYRATPVFQSQLDRITLSPSWHVPPTIFKEDALPAIRRNRNYLVKHRLHVYNAAGQRISPSAVNWWRPGNISLRQEPGPEGALGELVLRFDNPYAVYLHDTPHKDLFDASRRTTSSGCIRVENIHELAVLLLDDAQQWSREALQAAIDERRTRDVPLPEKVPILLAYWTVQVDPDGYVAFRPDVYTRDPAVLQALDAQAQ
ncbi:MAG: hypothetical protein K0S46_1121 [Moraxellaceae bacterium]|jgi:murein L,D-transpeptidase YcbB/YkuD|nr:hypothetical protein [Moraxellaceae bacterium]